MRRRILRGLVWAGLAISLVSVAGVGWLRATAADVAKMPALANGDLVFQTDRTAQMLAILFATGSVYTHVGVVAVSPGGEPMVIEAARTVRQIPLSVWLMHGYGRRVMVERFGGFSPDGGRAVVAAAADYKGRPYDIFFLFRKDHIYCSELVFYAFRDALGLNIGQVQTVSELNTDNFAVRRILALRWRRDPVCQTADIRSFDDCFAKIRAQSIITPVSLARDPRLRVIYSNYGIFSGL